MQLPGDEPPSASLPPSPPATPGAVNLQRNGLPRLTGPCVLLLLILTAWSFLTPRVRPSLTENVKLRYPYELMAGSNASSCPDDWRPGVPAADGSTKCYRVPQRFGTHYECATALCSTSDANGTVHEASLATLGSIEENLWLLGALSLQGKDLWIGLYRGETDAAQATAAGNSTFASTWRWASGHRSGESLNAWRTGQPDARFGREDCGFISGSTGEWEDFACDLREMRCLCELGNSATAAYRETMRSHAEAMRATSKRQRVWAAIIVGGFIALPLFHGGPQARSNAGGGDKGVGKARRVAIQLGLVLFFCGFAPFIFHYAFGAWHAMQLGAWPSYACFGALGGFLLLEAVPSGQQWKVAGICSFIFVSISTLCILDVIRSSHIMSSSRMCLFIGFALINAQYGYGFLSPLMTKHVTTYDIYKNNYRCGTSITNMGAAFLLLCFMGPVYLNDPDLAWQHPYAPGTATTAITWSVVGLVWSRHAPSIFARLFGDASNEQQHCLPTK